LLLLRHDVLRAGRDLLRQDVLRKRLRLLRHDMLREGLHVLWQHGLLQSKPDLRQQNVQK